MIQKHWENNLANAIGATQDSETIKTIFSAMLELTIKNDWRGACHESCGAIHILLNESGIENIWCIGEAQIGSVVFDHSWIEISSHVYDIAICKPLKPSFNNGAVIKDLDINTNLPTTTQYGVVSGHPDDIMTLMVKQQTLSDYLESSPVHPSLGTWYLIDQVAKHKLKKSFDIPVLMEKYQGQYFTVRP